MNYLTKEYGITKKMLDDLIRKRLNEEGFGSSGYRKDGAYKPYPNPDEWDGGYIYDPYKNAHSSFTEEAPLLEIYVYSLIRVRYGGENRVETDELKDVVTIGDIPVIFGKKDPRAYMGQWYELIITDPNGKQSPIEVELQSIENFPGPDGKYKAYRFKKRDEDYGSIVTPVWKFPEYRYRGAGGAEMKATFKSKRTSYAWSEI